MHGVDTLSVSSAGPPLPAVEQQLARGVPFGSHRHISQNRVVIYTRFLDFLASRSAAARDFLDGLEDLDSEAKGLIFRDALTRRTIEDGVCRIAHDIDTIEADMLDALLAAAAGHVATTSRTLLNNNARCIPFSHTGRPAYLWADDRCESVPAQRFKSEMLKRLPGFRIDVPTDEQIAILTAGAACAGHIAPELAESALDHAYIVVIGSFPEGAQFKSATLPGLAGIILLSPAAVTDMFDTAQVLLHEAFHLKFLDIDYVHPLFAQGFRQESSPRITPAWHVDKPGYGNWPIDRLLTSMHVYLALSVFMARACAVRLENMPSVEDLAAEASKCRSRAGWLFDKAQEHVDLLSPSGRDFVAFNGSLLGRPDTAI